MVVEGRPAAVFAPLLDVVVCWPSLGLRASASWPPHHGGDAGACIIAAAGDEDMKLIGPRCSGPRTIGQGANRAETVK